MAASVRVAVAAAFLRLALPAASSLAVAVAAIGLAFAASVRVAVAASAVGFAFVACSVRVALAAVTVRHTHSLHICKFFLMYTAVQPLAISAQLKASTLSPKPLCTSRHLPPFYSAQWPALKLRTQAQPSPFRDNTNNLFHSFLKQYRPGFRR